MRGIGTALVGLFCAIGAADACSIAQPTLLDVLKNKRVKQGPDCSFVNWGLYDDGAGEAAHDLGNGRVVQMIVLPGPTYARDRAVVVDCRNGESLIIVGKNDSGVVTSCGVDYELGSHLKPRGPLDLAAGGDLTALAAKATRFGIETERDANSLNTQPLRKDQVDLFCGCKLFYPDLAEASQ